jgi:hypothetical protein
MQKEDEGWSGFCDAVSRLQRPTLLCKGTQGGIRLEAVARAPKPDAQRGQQPETDGATPSDLGEAEPIGPCGARHRTVPWLAGAFHGSHAGSNKTAEKGMPKRGTTPTPTAQKRDKTRRFDCACPGCIACIETAHQANMLLVARRSAAPSRTFNVFEAGICLGLGENTRFREIRSSMCSQNREFGNDESARDRVRRLQNACSQSCNPLWGLRDFVGGLIQRA